MVEELPQVNQWIVLSIYQTIHPIQKNFCLQYRKGTNTYAVDATTQPSKGVCLQNLVTNGDFRNGSTGWAVSNSSVIGGRMRTYTTTAVDAYFFQTISGMTSSSRMYARFDIEVINGQLDFNNTQAYAYSSTGSYSIVYQEDNSGLLFDNHGATISDYYVDNIKLYNLTALFGAGNEPTKATMDTLMTNYPDIVAKANI